jgi:PAS domain S-box-containing protein
MSRPRPHSAGPPHADDYRTIVERTPDAIAIVKKGRFVFINDSGARLFGCRHPSEVTGRRMSEFVHVRDRAALELIACASRIAPKSVSSEIRVMRSDGRVIEVEMAAIGVEWGGETAVEIVGRDVTERNRIASAQAETLVRERQAREAAEKAGRARDDALMTLSHELRTPLTPILGWVRLLRNEDLDQATYQRALQVIEQNVTAEARLVDELMDLSVLLAGKSTLQVSVVDLRGLAQAALELVRPLGDAKSISLRLRTDRRSCAVAGDPVRLQQVAWNLLTNAIKFTPEAGQVTVLVERYGQSNLRLSVADSGCGITSEFLPRVFDKYSQEAPDSEKGLGLGLAIVQRVVEMHGGEVLAESSGAGKGARFTVILPAAGDNRRASGPDSLQEGRADFSPRGLAAHQLGPARDSLQQKAALFKE